MAQPHCYPSKELVVSEDRPFPLNFAAWKTVSISKDKQENMCPLGKNSIVRNSCATLFWNLLPFFNNDVSFFFFIQPFTISFISAQSDRWSSRGRDLWKTFQKTMLQNLRNSYRSSSEGYFWGKNWIFCALIQYTNSSYAVQCFLCPLWRTNRIKIELYRPWPIQRGASICLYYSMTINYLILDSKTFLCFLFER